MKATLALIFASVTCASITPQGPRLFRRQGQAFDPEEGNTTFADNCQEAFGPSYVECVPSSGSDTGLCIQPSEGDVCCENKWGCPGGSFCLVQDLCCPDGLDPSTCASNNGVTLPSDFGKTTASVPTATQPSSEISPSTTSTPSSGSGATTTTSPKTTSTSVTVNSAGSPDIGLAFAALAGLLAF